MSKALELREQAAAKFKEAHGVVDGKDTLTAEETKTFDRLMGEATELDAKFQQAASTDDKIGTLRDRLDYYHGKATGNGPIPWNMVQVIPGQQKSLGQQFIESGEYKELTESGALESDNARFKTAPMRPKGGTKAPGDVIGSTGAGTGGALVTPQYLPGIVAMPQRPLVIRDLFSQDTTQGDTISFAQQTAFDPAAAPVAQATSISTGLKPQSSIGWTRKTNPVEAIATWMAATRRQLSDAGQTRSLIDNQLTLMLKLVQDDQILNGTGTSPNLRGVLNVVGVQTLDISAAALAKFQNLDAIRDGIRLVKTGAAKADADGVVLNPLDAAIIDEQKDTQNRYIGNGPFDIGPQTLWRRPRIESEAIPAGKALVGSFKQGGTVFQREAIAIFASDSHADFFVRNLVAVLAEERLGFAVFFPAAFVYVTLHAW